MKLCPMAADDAKSAPAPELSCPHIVVSTQQRLRVYPHLFLLKRQHLVPFALETRDVVFAALDKMRSAGKLMVVPQWDEKVVESI
jgi:hypothetical protein